MPEALAKDITGVILVGGKSSRMGKDKAFLVVEGKPLFRRVLDLFRESFARVVLVGNRGERFAEYAVTILPDLIPGSSLGGVYTGLVGAGTEWIFVSSCDLPYPSAKVLRHLCSLKEGFDAVVPSTPQGYEPLFALYSKRCIEPIKALLDSGECCAYAYYPQIRVRHVLPEELAPFDPKGIAFLNLNTPEELAKIGGAQ